MKELAIRENININMFDTTNKKQREISLEVADVILSDFRNKCIEELQKDYK